MVVPPSPATDAVIVVVPALIPVTTPSSTPATVSSLDVQTTDFTVVSLGVNETDNVVVPPTETLLSPLIEMEVAYTGSPAFSKMYGAV